MNGKLIHLDGRPALRFERHYPHLPAHVWRALVEPASLAQWFPTAIEGERAQGASLRFVFPGDEGPALGGTFRVFDPPHRLEYTWGEDVLRWELAADRDGCRVVFTTTVGQRSSAPRDASGWHGCLENLASVLAGTAPSFSRERFPALYREYSLQLGLGEFPPFLMSEEPRPVPELLPNPALVGRAFTASSGTRLALLRATRDAETEEYVLESDAYLLVLEGTYTLRLGDHELAIGAGMEFHVPGGGRVSGRATAGTRLIYATEPRPPR